MCTLSWHRTGDRLSLWFNRDEQRRRAPALPPRVHPLERAPSPRFLAPVDPCGGGTWIFVNARGLLACLTNHYHAASPARPVSRGRLLTSLAGARHLPELADILHRQIAAAPFAPFHLWAATLHTPPHLWCWDGRTLRQTDPGPLPMHTTSSHRSAEVVRTRRETFHALIKDPAAPTDRELETYQRQHDPARPAHSVRMTRDDAHTVSLTHVDLRPHIATMTYEAPRLRTSHTLTQ